MDLSGVSVLIPVHGETPFLGEALRSINTQEVQFEVEILIALDRPSSTTREFLRTYESRFPLRLEESPQIGIVAALNIGLIASQYEFIARLDADDVMVSGRLQAQFDFLQRNFSVSVVGSQIKLIDTFGEYLGQGKYPSTPKEIQKSLPNNCCLAHPAVMYRRSQVIQVGGYRKFYEFAEDYDLWLRILEVSSLANLTEEFTLYRIHGQQTSNLKRKVQVAASRAVNESYARRIRGDSDLQDLFNSPESWLESSQDSSIIEADIIVGDFLLGLNKTRFAGKYLSATKKIFCFGLHYPKLFKQLSRIFIFRILKK
jgi:glycosyltransferase involved in cell wall biosynthesis